MFFATGYNSGPLLDMASVTPADSDLTYLAKGIYVGVSGDVKITTPNGTDVTLTALAAGVVHPICARRIWSTGTTATGILQGK